MPFTCLILCQASSKGITLDANKYDSNYEIHILLRILLPQTRNLILVFDLIFRIEPV